MLKPKFPQPGYKKFREDMEQRYDKEMSFEQTGAMYDALPQDQRKDYDKPFLEEREQYTKDFKQWRHENPSSIELERREKAEYNKQNPNNGYAKFGYEVRDEYTGNVTMQFISDLWKELTPEERQVYNDAVNKPKQEIKQKEEKKLEKMKKQAGIVEKPKRPPHAYTRFQKQLKERDSRTHNFTEVAALWAVEPQENKDKLEAEYQVELEVWKPQFEEWKVKHGPVEEPKDKKDEVDPDKPKLPLNAYFRFGKKIRDESDKTVSMKEIAAQWQELAEEEKDSLNAEYRKEREIYDVLLDEYYVKKEQEFQTKKEQKKADQSVELKRRRPVVKQVRLSEDESSSERPRKSITSKTVAKSIHDSASASEKKQSDLKSEKSKKITKK